MSSKARKKPIHIGGLTALIFHGKTHHGYPDITDAWYVMPTDAHMPLWFEKHDWNVFPCPHRTNFILDHLGLTSWKHDETLPDITISTIERATLECFHWIPRKFCLIETYQNLECLGFDDDMDIPLLQTLLEQCLSEKVKKLFLAFAEHQEAQWFDHINLSKISLGTGIQVVSPFEKGTLNKKYSVMIPKRILSLDDY